MEGLPSVHSKLHVVRTKPIYCCTPVWSYHVGKNNSRYSQVLRLKRFIAFNVMNMYKIKDRK